MDGSIARQDEDKEDVDNDSPLLLDLRSRRTATNAGAVGNDDTEPIQLTKLGSSIGLTVALLWLLFLVLNVYLVFKLQPFARISRDWSTLQISCFLGVEIGLITIVALFVSLIPAMILTWTTALLFDYACSRGLARRELLVQDGNQLAREIVLGTLKSIVRKGNFMAVLVTLSCLLGAYFSSHVLELQGRTFNFG